MAAKNSVYTIKKKSIFKFDQWWSSKIKPRIDPACDKLFKVRPVIDTIKIKIDPEEHNSVDEIMIPFKEPSSLKQYIRNNPHKWRIKVFARAGTSGIVYDFDMYVGKGTTSNYLGISGDIVIKHSKNLPKNQNVVYG